MISPRDFPVIALTLACVTTPLATSAADDHHQQAHVHGEAQLQIAIDGHTAELILRSPAANLLGFEHQPKTEDQENTLMETREWLTTMPVVEMPGNDCTLVAGTIHNTRFGSGDDDHGHNEDNHSDVEVTQRLECENALADSLTTPLMERFPGIEALSVEWISTSGQGHTELHAGESDIELAP